ncbi:ectonucleoside triphosphate diphosphohydrolase 5-like [Melanaphis sacchari]|uniref:ectonucleoside triphosphate diphosphohydrolase 5-like n=1 Tax=Melanaphis sacchari TaxID=742174 RepID=UPI000DC1469A|nr:ectonucleoside triphosphate diphosphohydrolase 5-like [Melanaphis sacchari]
MKQVTLTLRMVAISPFHYKTLEAFIADGSYLELDNYIFKREEGGLAQYREDLLRNLVQQGEEFLNKNPNCGTTPLLLRATAKSIFSEYNKIFQVDDNSVIIMDGDDEGLFAWFTVNYLLDRLNNLENSVAVLDLGGASLQITYFPTHEHKIPNNTRFIKEYSIMGTTKKLYNQSAEDSNRSPIMHYLSCKNYIETVVKQSVESVHLDKNIVAISFFYYQVLNANLIGENGGDVTLQQIEKVVKRFLPSEDVENAFAYLIDNSPTDNFEFTDFILNNFISLDANFP